MRRIHGTVVLAVLLAFGLSVTIPMEDRLETPYDKLVAPGQLPVKSPLSSSCNPPDSRVKRDG